MKILVVDDNEVVREVFKNFSIYLDMEIITIGETRKALDLYRRYLEHNDRIDLVIVDYEIDSMNGIELFKEIRKIDKTTQGILITGSRDHNIRQKMFDSGFSGMVTKPIDFNVIKKLILKLKNK